MTKYFSEKVISVQGGQGLILNSLKEKGLFFGGVPFFSYLCRTNVN